MRFTKNVLAYLCIGVCLIVQNGYGKKMAVGVPVLDVRYEPLSDSSFKPSYPMLSYISGKLETQLLYGDVVNIISDDDRAEWAYVETPQMSCDKMKKNALTPLCGYVLQKYLVPLPPETYEENATINTLWSSVYLMPDIESNTLVRFSYGTRLCIIDQSTKEWFKVILLDGTEGYVKAKDVLLLSDVKKMSVNTLRTFVVDAIKPFYGQPYVWGGVSAHDPENKTQTTGVDCSGLAYLIYNKVLDIKDFPRFSEDQYLHAAVKVESGAQLSPADLICFARTNAQGALKISHVVMYLGDGTIGESTGLGLSIVPEDLEKAQKLGVRKIAMQDFLGIDANEFSNEQVAGQSGRVAFLCRYIGCSEHRGSVYVIDHAIRQRITNKSWDENNELCPKIDHLRYLTIPYWGYDDKEHWGEMIVHKDVADEVLDIFQELFWAHFPIQKMSLVDDYFALNETRQTVTKLTDIDSRSMVDNNTSAFFFRSMNTCAEISKHGLGRAVDINPLVNPFIKGDFVDPVEGTAYCDRSLTDVKGLITLDGVCVQAFKKRGWVWGGDWQGCKDFQHFEKPCEQ